LEVVTENTLSFKKTRFLDNIRVENRTPYTPFGLTYISTTCKLLIFGMYTLPSWLLGNLNIIYNNNKIVKYKYILIRNKLQKN